MNSRPLAVGLVALYLCLKAAALTVCVIAVHLQPSTQSTANRVIEGLVPFIMATHDIWSAPLFALVDATLGIGIWFLQKWARTIVVIDLAWLYGRALVGLPVVLAAGGHSQNPSMYFDINIVAGIMMLAALCDPDVKRAFGMRF
jgi:hypothetical protein